jgi:5'-nucleotidase
MRILVDMDGVIADLEGGFLKIWRAQYPEKHFIPSEQRTTFYMADQYPDDIKDLVHQIHVMPSFFRSLEPIEGSLKALNEMKEMGHEVFICSSPLSRFNNCVLEKYEWVDSYLGKEWVKAIILCKDKTVIKGDILIDDRPNITGCDVPSWEHVLYDQPYNRAVSNKRRLSWDNWKSVLVPSIA